VTAHDWLCAGATFAVVFGIFLAVVWYEERRG
jgi:hypothetical protein